MNLEIIRKTMPLCYRRIIEGKCPTCGEKACFEDFKNSDELSRREFQISGMCQKCQDKVFGKKK